MTTVPRSPLIYDWNKEDDFEFRHKPDLELNDETLRDGLQSPSVRDPELSQKIRLLHLMEELGIASLDIGLPGAGPHAVELKFVQWTIAGRTRRMREARRVRMRGSRPLVSPSETTSMPASRALSACSPGCIVQTISGRYFSERPVARSITWASAPPSAIVLMT